MKATILKPIDVNVKFLELTIRGIESWSLNKFTDRDWKLQYGLELPFRDGDDWNIVIDLDAMLICDWDSEFDTEINMKVLKGCKGRFLDENLNTIFEFNRKDDLPQFIADTEDKDDGLSVRHFNILSLDILRSGEIREKKWMEWMIKHFLAN